jgi:glycine oxidase
VTTRNTRFQAPVVVNCAGAWAAELGGANLPTRPIKGQMLALVPEQRQLVRHVIRAPGVYLIPRGDGRIVVGATLEDVGFDKRVDPTTIQALHQKAAGLVPELGEARMLEAWAGLRPATPDQLPILGRADLDGYFVATGHCRDGILLAPITAVLMTQVIRGQDPELDITAFSPVRFR